MEVHHLGEPRRACRERARARLGARAQPIDLSLAVDDCTVSVGATSHAAACRAASRQQAALDRVEHRLHEATAAVGAAHHQLCRLLVGYDRLLVGHTASSSAPRRLSRPCQ